MGQDFAKKFPDVKLNTVALFVRKNCEMCTAIKDIFSDRKVEFTTFEFDLGHHADPKNTVISKNDIKG